MRVTITDTKPAKYEYADSLKLPNKPCLASFRLWDGCSDGVALVALRGVGLSAHSRCSGAWAVHVCTKCRMANRPHKDHYKYLRSIMQGRDVGEGRVERVRPSCFAGRSNLPEALKV